MSHALAEHDRMIAAMLMPCAVVGVDLPAATVRVSNGAWTSAWVRWHSLAAGKARHWRAPSLGEQGVLFNPSGQAGMGTFIPGLYGNAGPPLITAIMLRSGASTMAAPLSTTGKPIATPSRCRRGK